MIERSEMKELLQSGELVLYYDTRSRTDIECTVSAIITRYNRAKREFEILLEVKDPKVKSVIVTPPRYVRRR